MKKFFFNFLTSLLIALYALSALEVNACGVENTFFDEYDTYVRSNEPDIETITVEKKKSDEDKQFVEKHAAIFTTLQQKKEYLLFSPNILNDSYLGQPCFYQRHKFFILYSSFLI